MWWRSLAWGHWHEPCICSCEHWAHCVICSYYQWLSTEIEPSSTSSICYLTLYSHSMFPWVYFVAHFLAYCAQIKKCHKNHIWWEENLLFHIFHPSQKHQNKVVFQTLSLSILLFLCIRSTLKQIPIRWWQSFAEKSFNDFHYTWSQVQTLKYYVQKSHRISPQFTCLVIRNVWVLFVFQFPK